MQSWHPHKLVFVDETASYLNSHRDYARSTKGTRAYCEQPYKSKKANLIAAISLEGMQAPWLVTGGSVNGDTFITYVKQILVPSLKPGQTVVLDNYSIHTSDEVRKAIKAAGCQLLFLPTYSPDFNPIEHAFSKLKAILKQVATETFEELSLAIKQALSEIELSDIIGWFKHAGYSGQYL